MAENDQKLHERAIELYLNGHGTLYEAYKQAAAEKKLEFNLPDGFTELFGLKK